MGSMERSRRYMFVNLTAGECSGRSSWADCSAVIVRGQFWCEKVKKAKGSDETLQTWYSKEKGAGGKMQRES